MENTLLLNVTFEPIQIISWQKAMTLWAQGKVEVIDEHDREVRAVSFSFKLPSVVRLLRFVRVRRNNHVPFTRSNIYARDQNTCQYCGTAGEWDDLTFDHVVPVAQGGQRSWSNIVTACGPCNRKKGARTPEEAGMALRSQPRAPKPSPIYLKVSVGFKRAPESWRDYLYWNAELES